MTVHARRLSGDHMHVSAQVGPLYEELAPVMGDLLRCRRGGVLAALLAACGRANCCQKEACGALAAAITSMLHSSGKTGRPLCALFFSHAVSVSVCVSVCVLCVCVVFAACKALRLQP